MGDVRDYVLEHNSLERFRADWLALIESVTSDHLRRM